MSERLSIQDARKVALDAMHKAERERASEHGAVESCHELDRLRAENQRLRDEQDTSLPIMGVVQNKKVEWFGIDTAPDGD